jgi:hypothetical protein
MDPIPSIAEKYGASEMLPGVKAAADVVGEGGSSSSAAGGAKADLKQRQPQHTGLDSDTPAGHGRQAAVGKQQQQKAGIPRHHTERPVPLGLTPQRVSWSAVRACVKPAVFGFGGHQVEATYQLWVAEQCNNFLFAHSLLLSLWVITSCLRSSLNGWHAFADHLPVHFSAIVPCAVTVVLTFYKQYR